MTTPDLTAVVVVGTQRKRAQRSLNSLCAQTVASRMEVLVMDLADEDTASLIAPPGVQVDIIRRPGLDYCAWARAEAARRAQSPLVAYIEEHCYATPTWAEHLLDTYQGPWVAVGYGFTNFNPQTYFSRATFSDAYFRWLHPRPPGPTQWLPGQNVSYRRETLLSFGDKLGRLLTPDYAIQEAMTARGLPFFSETRALTAHENFEFIGGHLFATCAYARLLAARRAEAKQFSALKRIFYGLAVIPGAPLIKTARMIQTAAAHPELTGKLLTALPYCIPAYMISAISESLGYLNGAGTAEHDTNYWEMVSDRSKK